MSAINIPNLTTHSLNKVFHYVPRVRYTTQTDRLKFLYRGWNLVNYIFATFIGHRLVPFFMSVSVQNQHAVKVTGKGQPIVFGNGLGLDQSNWSLILPALSQKFQCITFDYAGTGSSESSKYDEKRYSDLSGNALDLIDICSELKLKTIIYVGHSIGAMTGILAAIERPDLFKKLILIAPSPRYLDEAPDYYGGQTAANVQNLLSGIDDDYEGWVRKNIPFMLNNPAKPDIEKRLIEMFLKLDKHVAKHFAYVTFFSDYREQLLQFKIPSLIVMCRNDVVSPIQVGDYLHAHLINSTLKVLNAQGHFPQLTNPDQVVSVIMDYLSTKRS